MATQRSTLALVQAASDIDQAPGTGREATKAETAADPYQRRLGSALSPFLTPFIPIQHRDERRHSWSASDAVPEPLQVCPESSGHFSTAHSWRAEVAGQNANYLEQSASVSLAAGSAPLVHRSGTKAGGLSLRSEAALRMYAAQTALLRTERAARPGTTFNPYPLHSIAVRRQAMASCCSVQARTSAYG